MQCRCRSRHPSESASSTFDTDLFGRMIDSLQATQVERLARAASANKPVCAFSACTPLPLCAQSKQCSTATLGANGKIATDGILQGAVAIAGSSATLVGIGSTGSEEYWGELEVSEADSFLSTWNVDGPQQAGQIMSLFKREALISNIVLDNAIDGA